MVQGADANDLIARDALNPREILILERKIAPETLRRLAMLHGEMVKYVVDVRREIIAIGGELHADAEAILLESGSRPWDLWGANYYPGQGREECIEYTSLINIRPALENTGMEVQDPSLRDRIRDITHRLIGTGEEI
jgi:uncharacterized protein DUF5674